MYVNRHVQRRNFLKPLGFFLGMGSLVSVVSHLRAVCRAMTLLYVGRGRVRGRADAHADELAAAREEKVLKVWRGRTRGAVEARANGRIVAAEAIVWAPVMGMPGIGERMEMVDEVVVPGDAAQDS